LNPLTVYDDFQQRQLNRTQRTPDNSPDVIMFYTFAFLSNRTTMVKFPGKVVNFCYYLQPRACMKSHVLCLLQ